MAVKYAKFIVLKSDVSGVVPTIPVVSDHYKSAWRQETDIYEGEFFLNTADQALFTRCGDTIVQISGTAAYNEYTLCGAYTGTAAIPLTSGIVYAGASSSSNGVSAVPPPFIVPFTGAIRKVAMSFFVVLAAPGTVNGELWLRKTDSTGAYTDELIEAKVLDAGYIVFSKTTLNISVTAGEHTLKLILQTNPTSNVTLYEMQSYISLRMT